MATATKEKVDELIEQLYQIEGKAEIVNGRVVLMSPTGGLPGAAADEIYSSLRDHARRTRQGRAVGDNKAFVVNLLRRRSFSPDAAFWTGDAPTMRFYEGAPVFAVEVRSENDYGAKAERDIIQKRADYFAAGTLVVWDVDLLGDEVVKSYRANEPENPRVFRRGELADAEPAVPGWTMPVDDLFA
ncbi:MAG TPA: Uma2 family endonuclease [Abditibacteriaceae bacterium]|jgi:Uma2 family endonuclease